MLPHLDKIADKDLINTCLLALEDNSQNIPEPSNIDILFSSFIDLFFFPINFLILIVILFDRTDANLR